MSGLDNHSRFAIPARVVEQATALTASEALRKAMRLTVDLDMPALRPAADHVADRRMTLACRKGPSMRQCA